jgi:integrase
LKTTQNSKEILFRNQLKEKGISHVYYRSFNAKKNIHTLKYERKTDSFYQTLKVEDIKELILVVKQLERENPLPVETSHLNAKMNLAEYIDYDLADKVFNDMRATVERNEDSSKRFIINSNEFKKEFGHLILTTLHIKLTKRMYVEFLYKNYNDLSYDSIVNKHKQFKGIIKRIISNNNNLLTKHEIANTTAKDFQGIGIKTNKNKKPYILRKEAIKIMEKLYNEFEKYLFNPELNTDKQAGRYGDGKFQSYYGKRKMNQETGNKFNYYKVGVMVLICSHTGARTEEALALKWSDVSFNKNTESYQIRIQRSLGKKRQEQKLKAKDQFSYRDVHITPATYQWIMKFQYLQQIMFKEFGHKWSEEHYLQTSVKMRNDGGLLISNTQSISSLLRVRLEETGKNFFTEIGLYDPLPQEEQIYKKNIGRTFYRFRHGFALDFIIKGGYNSINILAVYMGHLNIETTQQYIEVARFNRLIPEIHEQGASILNMV